MKYSLEQIRSVINQKGYKFFDSKKHMAYNVNIVGVRHSNVINNEFDDLLYLIYSREFDGDLEIYEYPITTDPGYYYINHPMNVEGTAILIPGQYRASFSIRKHQRRYDALCQSGILSVWRDNDHSKLINPNARVYHDASGINIHRSSPTGASKRVGKWSAGCQVFQDVHDFDDFMEVCYKSRENFGNQFTYTLLTEKDFKP